MLAAAYQVEARLQDAVPASALEVDIEADLKRLNWLPVKGELYVPNTSATRRARTDRRRETPASTGLSATGHTEVTTDLRPNKCKRCTVAKQPTTLTYRQTHVRLSSPTTASSRCLPQPADFCKLLLQLDIAGRP